MGRGIYVIRCHIHSDMLTPRTSPQLYLLRQVRLCSNERHSAHGRSPAGTRECLACTWPRMPGYLWPSNAAALPQRAGLLGLVSAARAQRLVPVEHQMLFPFGDTGFASRERVYS